MVSNGNRSSAGGQQDIRTEQETGDTVVYYYLVRVSDVKDSARVVVVVVVVAPCRPGDSSTHILSYNNEA